MTDLLDVADIERAAARIAGRVHRTPVMSATTLGELTSVRLWLKAELFQKTGSFKVRGVLNRLATLDPDVLRGGLVSMSAGNHAAALAMAAASYGTHATIVMPAGAVPAKVAATEAYGGEVVLTDRPLMEVTDELRYGRGLTFVHPFDDVAIMAGHGTVGLELAEDVPDLDAVIVPVGGGGLISGVATAVRARHPRARIIGVEPELADVMTRSLALGRAAHLDRMRTTIADGLNPPFAGEHAFRHVRAFVDSVVTVGEDDLRRATALQMERAKLYAEPSGAAPLAALLSGAAKVEPGSTVVCVVSGGNVNPAVLRGL